MLNSTMLNQVVLVRTEDDVTQDISITVVEGSKFDSQSITYISDLIIGDAIDCIELGSHFL